MRTSNRIPAALIAVAAIVIGATTTIAGNASATVKVSEFHLAGDVKGVTVTSETDYADGTALVSYLKDGTPYRAAGPDGSTITFKTEHGRTSMSLAMPKTVGANDLKTGPRAAHQAASEFVHEQSGGQNSLQIRPNALGVPCITPSGKGGWVCDMITMQDSNADAWIVGDNVTGSASDINHLDITVGRPGSNPISWSPNTTVHPSACGSLTMSASYNYNGVTGGVSQSTPVCPDTIAPTVTSDSYRIDWDSINAENAGSGFVNIWHIPPGETWGINLSADSWCATFNC